MRKYYNAIATVLFGVGLIVSGCQKKDSPQPAHLRFLSMVPQTNATVSIDGKGPQQDIHKKLSIKYADSLGYQTLPPGHYHISMKMKGKVLLFGEYVMGKNGYYTLLTAGLLPNSWAPNPESTIYWLKNMLAGSEAEDNNQFMPQWIMMRDNFEGSTKHAFVRFINSNPFTSTVAIKESGNVIKSGLTYPRETGLEKLKPGTHIFSMNYGNIELGQKTITIKAGYIYSVFIGKGPDTNQDLTIRVLENPSRALSESQ